MKKRTAYLVTALIMFALALAFAVPAIRAELPVPAVQYDRTIPGLEMTFTVEGLFPPVGAASWDIFITRDGITSEYPVPGVNREVFIYTPPLRTGSYFIQAFILDADGVALDSTPLFSWTLEPPTYRAEIPRVVVGGTEAWDTGLALTYHSGEAVTVTWELYSESGSLVATDTLEIQPHAAPAFNFAPYVQTYLSKTLAEPGIFTGSAVVRANVPVAMTYQCRPYAPGTAPGIAFGMVLQMVE